MGKDRVFPFKGPDRAYIDYLERRLVTALSSLRLDQGGLSAPAPYASHAHNLSTGGYQFIECNPQAAKQAQPDKPATPATWSKQFHNFLKALPTEAGWLEARRRAGVDTPVRNQNALKSILGNAGVVIFHGQYPSPGYQIPSLPSRLPTDSEMLVVRGYQYGNFVSHCGQDRDFAETVATFQDLVFCSYCEVMIKAGVSLQVTNDTMRQYTGADKSDLTLERYRRGAVWANRCMAALFENGWGHRSWELFLLGMFLRQSCCSLCIALANGSYVRGSNVVAARRVSHAQCQQF
ncbi:uncharacterized protein N7496_000850 [Penicillium cataractarum]|uniref:Uncharacterized protein n=1 Tax=Penicillium cataractarum TaxID=2100454 RepID=A0A9X0B6I1_9EURO|nr:uncharacterized protein N7496_000850 [Penicillium cataractarum]KAJ5389782.1 hypothetical protein N7496_000850 [Penicillium cataractarum]